MKNVVTDVTGRYQTLNVTISNELFKFKFVSSLSAISCFYFQTHFKISNDEILFAFIKNNLFAQKITSFNRTNPLQNISKCFCRAMKKYLSVTIFK